MQALLFSIVLKFLQNQLPTEGAFSYRLKPVLLPTEVCSLPNKALLSTNKSL